MNIRDIIQDKYEYLLNSCSKDRNISFPQSKTKEDVLNDVCLTAIRKFNNKDISFEEGFDYLLKNFYIEIKYCGVRADQLVFMDDYSSYEDCPNTDYDEEY